MLASNNQKPLKEGEHSSPSINDTPVVDAPKINWTATMAYGIRVFLQFSAFGFAILPSGLKMYETSHWFKAEVKEWFGNSDLLFQKMIDDKKVMMRIYFLILPYVAMVACLFLAHLIPMPTGSSAANMNLAPFWLRNAVSGRMLRRTIPFPKVLVRLGAPDSVSVGEILGVMVFLFLNLGTMGVRVMRYLPKGTSENLYLVDEGDAGKEEIPAISWPALEIWAKTLGVISIINLGWYLLMPIGRRSVLRESLRLSWERAIKYHRWVGNYTAAIMFVHGLLFVLVLAHGNGNPRYDPEGVMLRHNLLVWGCSGADDECDDDQRMLLSVNMFGMVVLVLIMTMRVFALPYFRRFHFEWFYYVHHLFILVLFFVCLHYKSAIIYLVPGIAIYTIDKLMGIMAYKNCARAKTEMVSSDVLEIRFKIDPATTQYKAGQYVFVNVPSVSHLQWHPYSLTSAPNANPGELFFHIKKDGMGESWTRQVVEAGRAGHLDMRIDGFYANPSANLDHKKAVILVGGGIGITPIMSLGMDLVATRPDLPVTILWVSRTVEEFEIFSATLYNAKLQHPNLIVKVWITLSLPEPKIAKETVDELSTEDEKCDLVVGLLAPPPSKKAACDDTNDRNKNNNLLFQTTSPGLEPLGNALAMLVAMIFALVGYATAMKVSRSSGIENQLVKTLVNVSMVMAMILLAFCLVSGARFAFRSGGPPKKPRSEDGSGSVESEETIAFESGHGFDPKVYKTMLRGHIGCRPDMDCEFRSLAEAHRRDRSVGFDTVGVLACGPKAMTKSINEAIHNSGLLATFWDAGKIVNKDGTDATFVFVEEEWEW